MCQEDCKQILNVETVSHAFKNNLYDLSNKIISCFYNCYKQLFLKWAIITYNSFSSDFIEFTADAAFTDGVLKLKENAINVLYTSNATIKSILFSFCKMQLLGKLQHEKRLLKKMKALEETTTNSTHTNNEDTAYETNEKLHVCLEQAMKKMNVQDRQIIVWRHIEEKSNDEIARLLDINTTSATNRIYRCMQRLKQLTENITLE